MPLDRSASPAPPASRLESTLLSALLRDVPLFRALPSTSDACLAALHAGEVRAYAAGATVVAAHGVPPLVVVLAGRVADGAATTARTGAHALAWALSRRALPAAVRADGDATAFVLPVDALEAALLACPALTLDFARALAAQVVDAASPPSPPAASS